MALLTLEKILSSGRDTKEVEVPEWKGSVIIQELSLAELREVGHASENDAEEDATRLLLKYGMSQPSVDDGALDAIIRKLGVTGTARVSEAISELVRNTESQEDREASF